MVVHTERRDAASDKDIEASSKRLGLASDSWVVGFWKVSDGALLNDQVMIYSVGDIEERNSTFEVDKNFKGKIAVGDDSGGRMILIDKSGVPGFWLVDSGSVSLDEFDRFESLEKLLDFIEEGEEGDSGAGVGDIITIGGCKPSLEEVVGIKKSLGVDLSVVHLKKILAEPGEVIMKSVYAQKYRDALLKYSHIIRFN
ncbi:SMI1/KNR4 family protein [Pseudomonas sp. KU43P]|uniref:SMI1/KNR4 family protein n=1 Tax=Pseudomonas sp. KU43P TaxID=2487887 RepID=UPI0012A9D9A9|nr:SMI1/KNR4 family protein [Pseudomonas sp. KU43P]BBH47308.1 hypothetical protein KU43P_37850 [Pseudomonas sp. KU43P]